jgi:fluoride exporter
MLLKNLLLVFLGGGLGSLGRYMISLMCAKYQLCYNDLPLHTFLVNITGCLLIGLAIGFFIQNPNRQMQLFCVVGFCGGFTTFSTFSLDFINLWKTGQTGMASLFLFLSVTVCLLMTLLGIYLMRAK